VGIASSSPTSAFSLITELIIFLKHIYVLFRIEALMSPC